MSTDAVAIIGFVALFVLMLLRVPVGMAMGLVGVAGFGYLVGGGPALKMVGHTSMRTVTDWNFAVVPLFLLMGSFATTSGMSRELFRAANAFLGHLRGGLGIATIAACGGFAAICGSSVATAATFSRVAYPEMRRYGYPQSFATGVIAAGGTLGIMIPPSTVLAVYGLITEQDIGKLFVAGIMPGHPRRRHVHADHHHHRLRAARLPAGGPARTWRERLDGLRDVWATLLLFVFVIGGIYGGVFTATEAAGMGAAGAFLIGIARGRLSRADILRSLLEATRTTAAVFTVLIGAILFGYFLTITQTPQKVTEFLTGLGLGRYGVLALIMLMYLVLGCLMDALAMIILTVPIIFPVIKAARLRSDLVRRHHRHDGGARADPSAGRHEHLRHKKRGRGREDLDHLLRRAAVHRHRHPAPDPADRLPDPGAVAAVEDVSSAPGCGLLSHELDTGHRPGMTRHEESERGAEAQGARRGRASGRSTSTSCRPTSATRCGARRPRSSPSSRRRSKDFDFTPGSFGVLTLIRANPGITQVALAAAFGVDKSTMSPVIVRLEKRGLVRREVLASDRRCHALYLRAGGRGRRSWPRARRSAPSRTAWPRASPRPSSASCRGCSASCRAWRDWGPIAEACCDGELLRGLTSSYFVLIEAELSARQQNQPSR